MTGSAEAAVDTVALAVRLADDTKAVLRAFPFSFTTEPVWNPEPFTVSVNEPADTDAGETPDTTGAGYMMVTEADATFCPLIACTCTVAGLGTADGAEYNPFESMYPIWELPPATPLTDHVTD